MSKDSKNAIESTEQKIFFYAMMTLLIVITTTYLAVGLGLFCKCLNKRSLRKKAKEMIQLDIKQKQLLNINTPNVLQQNDFPVGNNPNDDTKSIHTLKSTRKTSVLSQNRNHSNIISCNEQLVPQFCNNVYSENEYENNIFQNMNPTNNYNETLFSPSNPKKSLTVVKNEFSNKMFSGFENKDDTLSVRSKSKSLKYQNSNHMKAYHQKIKNNLPRQITESDSATQSSNESNDRISKSESEDRNYNFKRSKSKNLKKKIDSESTERSTDSDETKKHSRNKRKVYYDDEEEEDIEEDDAEEDEDESDNDNSSEESYKSYRKK